MRITHVVAGALFAGTERYVVEVANALTVRGHTVTVIGGETLAMRSLLTPGICHRTGDDGWSALASLVRTGKQDVVHAHLPRSERIAALGAPANRSRRIVTEHLDPIIPATLTARVHDAVLHRVTDRRIAVSREIAAQLPEGTTVLLNAVPNQDQEISSGPGGSPPTVLVAQRLHPQKDTATAIRAWSLSGLAEEGWHLSIAGHGGEKNRLAVLARTLGVEGSVTFLGWRPDVHALMGSAEIFLAPARREPLGLAVLEAMSRGVPVVASRAGGHLETMASLQAARLFPVGDAETAGALLRDLAFDPGSRHEYGLALRKVQRERFDQERHVDALERIYAG